MSTKQLPRTFPELDDEDMVLLCEQWGFAPARTALILRHHEWADDYLRRLGARRGLQDADIDDLRQTKHSLLVRAIAYFHRCPAPHHGSFASFLCWFIGRRGVDEVRKIRRQLGHYEQSAAAAEALRTGYTPGLNQDIREGCKDDPARVLARRELEELLQCIDMALPEPDHTILELMLMRASTAAIAAEVGLSERTVRWHKAALVVMLRPILGKYLPREDGE